MKRFFLQIRDSIYDPKFYTELRATPISFSFKYFWKLALLFAVLGLIVGSAVFIPKANRAIEALPANIVEWYPQDLVLTIKDGKVSSNQKEPYFIVITGDERIVIDTKTPFSSQQFETYDVRIWMTEDSIVFKNGQQTQVTSLVDASDIVIDRDLVVNVGVKLEELLDILPTVIIPIVAFLAGFFYVLYNAFYLLIVALLVMLMGHIMRQKFTYAMSYRIALHAMTLPLFVSLLFVAIAPFDQPRFLFTAMLLVIAYINMRPTPLMTPTSDASTHLPA